MKIIQLPTRENPTYIILQRNDTGFLGTPFGWIELNGIYWRSKEFGKVENRGKCIVEVTYKLEEVKD